MANEMLRVFDPTSRRLTPASALPEVGWAHLSDPSAQEIALLGERVPASFIAHALDVDEVARTDRQGDATLIIVRAPLRTGDPELPYRSEAIGIVMVGGLLVTMCRSNTDILDGACELRALDPSRPERFFLLLTSYVGERFLGHVRDIDRVVNELESRLRASLANQEVLELLKYQKGLVHFTTALFSNQLMLERLAKDRHLPIEAEDADLFEDAVVEIRQAIEMARVSADILSNMMDAFASIISNNLNVVMKVLTAATLVLTGPMLIVSFYGMNVQLPGQSSPFAFAGLFAVAIILSVVVTFIFWRRRWL